MRREKSRRFSSFRSSRRTTEAFRLIGSFSTTTGAAAGGGGTGVVITGGFVVFVVKTSNNLEIRPFFVVTGEIRPVEFVFGVEGRFSLFVVVEFKVELGILTKLSVREVDRKSDDELIVSKWKNCSKLGNDVKS